MGVLLLAILAGNNAWNASESTIGTYLSGPATQSDCGQFGPWDSLTVAEYCLTHAWMPNSPNPNGNMFSPQQLQSIDAAFSQVAADQRVLNASTDWGVAACIGLFFGVVIMTRPRVEYVQSVVRRTVIRIRRES